MGIIKKNKRSNLPGAPGVSSAHAIFPKPLPAVKHGFYLDLTRLKIDGRTRLYKVKNHIRGALLDRFPSPAPPVAQVIADRCAIKLIRASLYEVHILEGKAITPNADREYLALTGSIRADIKALHEMARDGGSAEKIPSLQEYLEHLKKARSGEPCES
jgi:hypothetical protein